MTKSRGLRAQLGPSWLNIEASVQREIGRIYSVSDTQRLEFSDEVSVQVKPASKVRVLLKWKTIWVNGVADVATVNGNIEIPYSVVRGVSFDYVAADIY